MNQKEIKKAHLYCEQKQIIAYENVADHIFGIIEEYIEKSAFIHSKENTTKNLYGPKIYNRTRFINTEIKIKQKELIKMEFEKMLSKRKISEDFDYLVNISKQTQSQLFKSPLVSNSNQ